MIVKFETVMSDKEEEYQRYLTANKGEDVPLFREKEKVGQIAIDLAEVVGWEETEVMLNDKALVATAFRIRDEVYLKPVLMKPSDVSAIWDIFTSSRSEKLSNNMEHHKLYSAKELLNNSL